jgi:hypothetical protein
MMTEIIDIKKAVEQTNRWVDLQNNLIGVFAFSFALACLSIAGVMQYVASATSVLMLLLMSASTMSQVPTELNRFRFKKNKTKHEKESCDFLENEVNAVSRYAVFTCGFLSLLGVFFYIWWPVFYEITIKPLTSG